MRDERTSQPISCTSAESARLYREAVDRMLASQGGAAERLDQVLAGDPFFAPAAIARYLVAVDAKEPSAKDLLARADEAASKAMGWERDHARVLLEFSARPSTSVDSARSHIGEYPADLLVVSQLAGYLFFHGGPDKRRAVLELLESVSDANGEDFAFLARLGFAASELGERGRGRELLNRALEARPEALYSVHGLAHVLHDEGDVEESAALLQDWLRVHEEDASGGQMYGHVQWHLALKEWQLGEEGAAWDRFRAHCAPETTTCGPILTLADVGGFLLRQFLVDARTKPLSESSSGLIDRVWGMIGHPFVALHVAGLYVTAGDHDGLGRCSEAVADAGSELSLCLATAMSHFGAGRYRDACDVLGSLSAEERVGVGGSNVERELIELVESECAKRSGSVRA